MSHGQDMRQFLLAAIVESSQDAILSIDLDGTVTSWNPAAEKLYGYTADEAVGRPVAILAAPGFESEMNETLERVRRGERVGHQETCRRRKDGRFVSVSVTASPVRDATGRLVGASKIARDLGERLRAQEERALLAAIVDSSDDAIVSKDLDGIVTSWNGAAEQLFGYGAAEMVGRPIAVLAPPGHEEEMSDILARIRRGERVDHVETQRRRKDGRIIDISLTVSPVRNPAGAIVGASKIVRDITGRKETERQFHRLTHEIDHRAKNALAVTLAILRMSRAETLAEYVAAVEMRVAALARVHALVAENQWRGAWLSALVGGAFQALPPGPRVRIGGPVAMLAPAAAQAVGFLLHELATNAAVHGALSVPQGSVDVTWSFSEDAGLTLSWRERGGPPVEAPTKTSYGTRLISHYVPAQLGGEAAVEWRPEGLRCAFSIPSRHIAAR